MSAEVSAAPPVGRRASVRSARHASWPTVILFLGPGLALYIAFVIHPAVLTFYDSLFTRDRPGLSDMTAPKAMCEFEKPYGGTVPT